MPDLEDAAKCGVPKIKPDTSKIVGGKDAIPYSWPWQVALFTASPFGSGYQFCAGSLIAPEWVVTAGHCFAGATQVDKYAVKLGVFNKSKDDEPGELVLGLKEIHVHPKYNASTITYDFTLLRLAKPVKFTDHISPICLPKKDQEDLPAPNTDLFVTGWGATRQGGPDSPTLKQVMVPLVDTDGCKASYPGQIYEDCMFCAGLKEGGKDSCQGDSGGPVVFQDAKTKTWKQIGITSWGYGCAQPNKYGVYSKVAAYIDFINQYVK